MSRFVRPETVRLAISNGDWLLVKARLNHGERRAQQARLYTPGPDDRLHIDLRQVGLALVTAYLLDWSLMDDDGHPVPIRGLSAPDLERVLDSLGDDDFREIARAIEAHDDRQAEARAEEKKRQAGPTGGAVTSDSPSAAAGASSGFVN